MREQRQYTSTLTVPEEGNYWLRFETEHGYGTLQVDGGPVVTAGRTTNGLYVHLTAGAHTLALTTRADRTDDMVYRLTWVTPRMAKAALDAAVALARRARSTVRSRGSTLGGHLRRLPLVPASADLPLRTRVRIR